MRSGDGGFRARLQNQRHEQQQLTMLNFGTSGPPVDDAHLMQELTRLETALDREEREQRCQGPQTSSSAQERAFP